MHRLMQNTTVHSLLNFLISETTLVLEFVLIFQISKPGVRANFDLLFSFLAFLDY
jgi:hypothetical protein